MGYTYRLANKNDVKYILDIYAPYITDTIVSFEVEVPSIDEFEKRFETISDEYPYIVCENKEKIIGFAYAHRYMDRSAYQWDAELSIYIDHTFQGKSIGQELYMKLFELLKLQNVINVYGCVTSPNPRSEALHLKLGFSKIGIFHNTGFKLNQWIDVVWFEKTIGEYSQKPSPFIPFQDIPKTDINKLLKKESQN